MDWKELQQQHAEWLLGMYPGQTPEIPAAGCVEEAGELLHAVLKLEQERRWGPEARYPVEKLHEELVDAVGDCCLYVVSLCNASGWSFAELMASPQVRKEPSMTVLQCCSRLVQLAASLVSHPGMRHIAVEYLSELVRISNRLDIAFDGAVQRTWSEVRRRTREKRRAPKVVCLCGSTRFKDEFIAANFLETMDGNIVLSVGRFGHADAGKYFLSSAEKLALDELHKRKIDLCDEVLVIDAPLAMCDKCGDVYNTCDCKNTHTMRPYIGYSTRSEIEYAVAHGKVVRYLSSVPK